VGIQELILIISRVLLGKFFSLSNNRPIGFYKSSAGRINSVFPTRKERKRIREIERSELFTLLPYDDETAAEEFAQAMIENNAMMIDIENPEEE